jgi:Fe2+ or Zn2+ uptake regulation protein
LRAPRIWHPVLLDDLIVDMLRQKKGVARDKEIYRMVKAIYKDVSPKEFYKAIMRLELRGLINVSSISKSIKSLRLKES